MSRAESPLAAQLRELSTPDKLDVMKGAVSELSEDERIEIAKGLRPVLPLPSDPMKDRIWLIIVSAFAFVMIGSATVLGIGVFIGVSDAAKQLTRADTILTVFT